MYKTICCVLLIFGAGTAVAQFSGFASASYGYQANPLSNYESISDKVAQSYLELTFDKDYDASALQIQYISGLMAFDKLSARNYYEHNLGLTYRMQLAAPPEKEDGEEENGTPTAAALAGTTRGEGLAFGLKGSARHDRSAYQDYDNIGADFTAVYTNGTEYQFFSLSNTASLRSYTYVPELSNMTDMVTARLLFTPARNVAYGFFGGIGVKQFTTSNVDTAQFTTGGGGGQGHGKPSSIGGSSGQGQGASKKIMANEQSNGTTQAEVGLEAYCAWSASSIQGVAHYRWSLGQDTRYVAQVERTTILGEDLYNDHFSYDGPEIELTYRQRLPLGIQASVKGTAAHRAYGAPAFSLLGERLADHRTDLRADLELYVSRYFAISGGFGLELAFGAAALRNQSNDEYNDFSASSFSVALGIGF